MAEGVFRDLVQQEGLAGQFEIESVGTGSWHVGDPPHRGTQQELRKRGIDLSDKRSRQVTAGDVESADYVIAMDQSNLRNLRSYDAGNHLAEKAHLLLDFADGANVRDVPDPYYDNNFGRVYELVEAGCHGLLDYIREEEGL